MPVYRRYRRAGYRRRRRYYYGRRRFYRRGYSRRYVNGSSRSAIRIKTNVTNTINKTSGYGTTLGAVYYVEPFGTGAESLKASSLYGAYCNLYEEVKLVGMKVNISVVTPVGGTALPSLQMYTAWDRRKGYGETAKSADQIKNMAISAVSTALNNNIAKIQRSIYASDLIEKAQWIDSEVDPADGYINIAWRTAAKNPNFFCPCFYMCFGSPTLAQGSQANVSFSASITYYVAFRNPRYGGSGSSKELMSKSVSFADDVDDIPPDDVGGASADVDMPPVTEAPAASAAAEPREGSLRRSRRAHPPGPVQKN